MDLNYLFYRQQVERSLAEAASTEIGRTIHEELASEYERQIVRVTAVQKPDDARPLFRTPAPGDLTETPKLNATRAIAMTAREFAPTATR